MTALLSRIGKQYVDNAKKELQSDIIRLALGVTSLAVMALFAVHAVIFAHVLVVLALVWLGLPPPAAAGVVFFVDLCVVGFMALMARLLLFRPLLPRTRKQVTDAWAFIVGPADEDG